MTEQKIDIVELSGSRITVTMEGFPVAYGNALRRLALSDVPTMAVDFAYFYDNESSVYDEIIAHRLGLVVLKSDEALRKYGQPEECAGASESDSHCYAQVYLEYEVPPSSSSGVYVKASDLKISDPDVKPVYPDTPIVYLAPGQRIHLAAYARLGRGYEHGKWSPAAVSVLRYSVFVDFNPSKMTKECLDCISAYPDLLRAAEEGKPGRLELSYKENTSALRYCESEACRGALSVTYDPSKLYLTVESTGALEPARIIWEATSCITRKTDKLLKELDEVQVAEAEQK